MCVSKPVPWFLLPFPLSLFPFVSPPDLLFILLFACLPLSLSPHHSFSSSPLLVAPFLPDRIFQHVFIVPIHTEPNETARWDSNSHAIDYFPRGRNNNTFVIDARLDYPARCPYYSTITE